MQKIVQRLQLTTTTCHFFSKERRIQTSISESSPGEFAWVPAHASRDSRRSTRKKTHGDCQNSTTRWTARKKEQQQSVAISLLLFYRSRRQGTSSHGRRGRAWTDTPSRGARGEGTLSESHGRTGEIAARVLFDGTHGIDEDRRTRVRDQERGPIEADVKRVFREKARYQLPSFELEEHVTEAHRQVPIDPQDWHFLGAQMHPGGWVYVNKVGTFGIASASCWWSRVAGAIGRIAQYILGHSAYTWHLLVADDYALDA